MGLSSRRIEWIYMVRAVDRYYNLWLAGYYDDFMNCRAVPDDLNQPSSNNTYSSLNSHHGNIMNGEALLNPRYRFSYPDRGSLSTVLNSISGVSLDNFKFTKNSGLFEWFSVDTTRNHYSTWGGRSQLQYPDGHIANRIKKFDSDTLSINSTHGYQLFCNGNETNSTYLVPTGQYDPTFGRSVMEAYETDDGSSGVTNTNYANKKAGVFETVTGGEANILNQQAHLTGVWTGETVPFTTSANPTNSFYPVKSPAGKPFLSIRRFETLDAGTNRPAHRDTPSIVYDGALNSRLDRDVFHMRVASRCFSGDTDATNTLPASGNTQSFSNGELPTRLEVRVGYPKPAANVTTSDGIAGTPAITFNLFLGIKESHISVTNPIFKHGYDCYGANYLGSSAQTVDNDNAWIDIDVRIDYTNQKFWVYLDGVNKSGTNGFSLVNTSFGGDAITADELYGWEATHTVHAVTSVEGQSQSFLDVEAVSYLLLDRVGLVHYITEDLHTENLPNLTEEITLDDMNLNMPTDGFSSLRIKVYDDATDGSGGTSASNFSHHLGPLFNSSNPTDWSLMLFASEEINRIDRPIWRGVINKMSIEQEKSSRFLNLDASHSISLLNRQIPMWDIGQLGLEDTLDTNTPYWLFDAQGIKNIMDMGTSQLKVCQSNLGFDKKSNYLVTNEQRMQLGSGHPIQMYNNEDTFGPNNAEDDWEGEQILGYFKAASDQVMYGGSGGTVRAGVAIGHTSGYTAGAGNTELSITNDLQANHNITNKDLTEKKLVESSGGTSYSQWYNGVKEWLLVATGDMTYTPESSKIFYMGKFCGNDYTQEWFDEFTQGMTESEALDIWESDFRVHHPHKDDDTSNKISVFFDSDPGLEIGDYFYINHINDADEINENANANSAGNMSPLPGHMKGRHRVFNIRKIRNYFGGYLEATPTGTGSYFWAVETESALELVNDSTSQPKPEGKVGLYVDESSDNANTHSLLTGNDRFSWVKSPKGNITPLSTGTVTNKTQYRNVHSRWMRDLPNSLWFQYHFGIIKPSVAAQNHSSTDILGGYESARSVSRTGNVLADISAGDTTIKISTDLYDALLAQGRHTGIGEIQAEGYWHGMASSHANYDYIFKDSGTQPNTYCKFIWQGLYATGGDRYLVGCKYINADFDYTLTASKTLFGTATNYRNIITVLPLDIDTNYKHLWILWADMRNDGRADADGGHRKKKFGLIHPIIENYKTTLYFTDQNDPETGAADKYLELKAPQDCHLWDVSGYDPMRSTTYTDTDGTFDSASFSRPVDYTTLRSSSSGNSAISNAGGRILINNITTSNLNAIGNKAWVHVSNSNKHDGTYRVHSKDTMSGTIQLKGTFIENDAGGTGGVRLHPTTADDSEEYQDWENKGGAMCIVDCSPFFNLNTHANLGRAGQNSGGRTDLTDYVYEGRGNVFLQDNYWLEAISNPFNSDETMRLHENWGRMISDATLLNAKVEVGDTFIKPRDISIFLDSGNGTLVYEEERPSDPENPDSPKEIVLIKDYFLWNSKNETERTGTESDMISGSSTFYTGWPGLDSGVQAKLLHLTDTGVDLREWGIQPNMVIENTTQSTVHRIMQVGQYENNGADQILDKLMIEDPNAVWQDGDDWKIPIQLGGVWSTPDAIDGLATKSHTTLVKDLRQRWVDAGQPYGTFDAYNIKEGDDDASDTYDKESVTISSTLANSYALRTKMHIEGRVESPNVGTFYDSDKFRTLWNMGICRNWLPETNLSCIFDINNIPISLNLTTDGTNSNLEDYGSSMKAGTRTIMSQFKEISKRAGFGERNNIKTNFYWLGGRDNRAEFRPQYNSGVAFDRDTVSITNYNTTNSVHITHVRVYYNQGKSFVDYPKPAINDSIRWKIIEEPDILTSVEAASIAKQEYNARNTVNTSLTIQPSATTYVEDGTNTMVANHILQEGRYGYVADQTIALQGTNDDGVAGAWSWTRLGTGGCLFPGMVNALNGNLGTTGTLYERFGQTKAYQEPDDATDLTWDKNFYWYGSNSISHAVQIVHIPNHCPFVSEQTGEEMRMFVTVMGGQAASVDIEDLIFQVFLIDYAYTGESRSPSISSGAFTGSDRVSSVQCRGNGFYEIEIPPSYWNNGGSAWSPTRKLTFSFNAEYCQELIRTRCGAMDSSIYYNSNTLVGISTGTSAGQIKTGNASSIFPLGGKKYDEFPHIMNTRTEWYAPRLHITRDLAYQPGTFVKYTDAGLGYNNETFSIKSVNYRLRNNSERLSLNLVKDESLRGGVIQAFLSNTRLDPAIAEVIPDLNVPIPEGNPGIDDWSPPIHSPGGGGNFSPIGNGDGDTGGTSNTNTNWYAEFGDRLDFRGDAMNFGSTLNYLGQTRTGTGAVRKEAIGSGAGLDMKASRGTGIKTSEGCSFPGKGNNSDNSEAKTTTTFSGEGVVPQGAVSDMIEVTSMVTHGVTGSTAQAELSVKVTCNNTSVTRTVIVPTGLNNQKMVLFNAKVTGANVAGRKITVDITRVSGSTNDTSDYNSLVLNDIRVNQQTNATQPSSSVADQFSPY